MLRTGFIERIGTIGIDREDREDKEFKELRERLSLNSLNSLIVHLNQQDKFVVRSREMRLITRNKFIVRRG